MRKLLITCGCLWVSVSIALSVAVTKGNQNVIEHRAGFLLVEVCCVADAEGRTYGYDQNGHYVGFDEETYSALVVFVYNPFNNECDDIMWRYDFKGGNKNV